MGRGSSRRIKLLLQNQAAAGAGQYGEMGHLEEDEDEGGGARRHSHPREQRADEWAIYEKD